MHPLLNKQLQQWLGFGRSLWRNIIINCLDYPSDVDVAILNIFAITPVFATLA